MGKTAVTQLFESIILIGNFDDIDSATRLVTGQCGDDTGHSSLFRGAPR